jgi:hypothetical protein
MKCRFPASLEEDMAWRTEAAFASASSGPDAMIVRSPVAALEGPPETGASMRVRPLFKASSWTWIARAAEGATVDDRIIVELFGSAARQHLSSIVL